MTAHLIVGQTVAGQQALQNFDLCVDVHDLALVEGIQLTVKGGDDGGHDLADLALGPGNVDAGDAGLVQPVLPIRLR